ncbi:MAG: hypothetical protein ACP5UZ_04345 [Thermoplasmata archaeon]
MMSRKVSVIIAVIVLIIFSTITLETIDHSSTTLTSTVSSDKTQVVLYSPINDTSIPISNQNVTINFNLSITSKLPNLYLFDISPSNVSSLPTVDGVHLLSLVNLTYLNKTLYPYNYRILNVTPGENSTFGVTLYINSSQFDAMNVSDPLKDQIYPYLVEIVAETSSGAAVIGFTILKV